MNLKSHVFGELVASKHVCSVVEVNVFCNVFEIVECVNWWWVYSKVLSIHCDSYDHTVICVVKWLVPHVVDDTELLHD